MALQWNTQDALQGSLERQHAAQQQAKAEADQRAQLRRELPYWRAQLVAHEEALVVWTANVPQAEAEEAAAWRRYLDQLHVETDGQLPRGPGGELVTVVDMGPNANPAAIAAQPAKAQWQAYQDAQRATAHARGVVRKLVAAIPDLKHNVTICERACGAGSPAGAPWEK